MLGGVRYGTLLLCLVSVFVLDSPMQRQRNVGDLEIRGCGVAI